MFQDGLVAHQRGDYAKAVKFFRPLADAQYSLGLMYDNGQGVQQDHAEAVKWFRKAAEQDDAEAAKWYRKAAEQGIVVAQFNIGVMYAGGEGVPQNHTEAVKWFRKAAERGYASAQFALGLMYGLGKGVPKDNVPVHMWFTLASAQGIAPLVRWRTNKCRVRCIISTDCCSAVLIGTKRMVGR